MKLATATTTATSHSPNSFTQQAESMSRSFAPPAFNPQASEAPEGAALAAPTAMKAPALPGAQAFQLESQATAAAHSNPFSSQTNNSSLSAFADEANNRLLPLHQHSNERVQQLIQDGNQHRTLLYNSYVSEREAMLQKYREADQAADQRKEEEIRGLFGHIRQGHEELEGQKDEHKKAHKKNHKKAVKDLEKRRDKKAGEVEEKVLKREDKSEKIFSAKIQKVDEITGEHATSSRGSSYADRVTNARGQAAIDVGRAYRKSFSDAKKDSKQQLRRIRRDSVDAIGDSAEKSFEASDALRLVMNRQAKKAWKNARENADQQGEFAWQRIHSEAAYSRDRLANQKAAQLQNLGQEYQIADRNIAQTVQQGIPAIISKTLQEVSQLKQAAEGLISEALSVENPDPTEFRTALNKQIQSFGSAVDGLTGAIDENFDQAKWHIDNHLITGANTIVKRSINAQKGIDEEKGLQEERFSAVIQDLLAGYARLKEEHAEVGKEIEDKHDDKIKDLEDALKKAYKKGFKKLGSKLDDYLDDIRENLEGQLEELRKDIAKYADAAAEQVLTPGELFLKALTAIIIGILVVIVAAVAAIAAAPTGGGSLGVGGSIIVALAGTLAGVAGGLIGTLVNNAIDGKPLDESLGAGVAIGAIQGLAVGLSFGAGAAVAPLISGLSGTAGAVATVAADIAINVVLNVVAQIPIHLIALDGAPIDLEEFGRDLGLTAATTAGGGVLGHGLVKAGGAVASGVGKLGGKVGQESAEAGTREIVEDTAEQFGKELDFDAGEIAGLGSGAVKIGEVASKGSDISIVEEGTKALSLGGVIEGKNDGERNRKQD